MSKYIIQLMVISAIFTGCAKEPGVGGEASISGKVHAMHYNSTFTVLLSEYDVPDTYVYLIFGDDVNYGTRIKTNYDGEYVFEYLYPGDYTLYTYSIDSAAIVNGFVDPPDSAMVQHITIVDKYAEIQSDDFIIYQ